MNVSLNKRLAQIGDTTVRYALYLLLKPLKERYRTCVHATAGLVIKAGSSALVKTGAAVCHLTVKGKNRRIAAATDMPALVGTVTNAMHNLFVFTIDEAGTTYVQMGTEAAAEASVRWPALNPERAIIGYIKVNPTGTGNFVGGTTALDDATVVPNVVYISPVGMFDPTAAID